MLIKCKKILRIENVGWLPLLNSAARSRLSFLLLIPALQGGAEQSRAAVQGDVFEPFQSFSVVFVQSL